MPAHRSFSFVAVLLLVGASGCASAPDAAPADATPQVSSAGAPTPGISAANATPEPSTAVKAAPEAASTAPADARTPSAQPAAPAAATAGKRAATPKRAPGSPSPGARPSSQARSTSPATGSEGPGVTTYVFSDAPVPVRRDAVRSEPAAAAGSVPEGFNPYGIKFAPGTYRCELGRSVVVRSVAPDLRSTVLRWGDDDRMLRAVDARSGALRYEDAETGLVWIVLRDRSMLLDTRAGQRLANACRAGR